MLCRAPGLFRSLGPNERAAPIHMPPFPYAGQRFTFTSDTQLGCTELRILQAVLSLAPRAPLVLHGGPDRKPHPLREDLDLSETAADDDVLLVRTSFAELNRIAGYSTGAGVHGGAMGRQVCDALRALRGLHMAVEAPDHCWGSRLLSFDLDGDQFGKLRIALNPRLSLVALKKPQFVHIDLTVARKLRKSPAILLHQILSARVPRPKKGKDADPKSFRIETLIRHLWPASERPNGPDASGHGPEEPRMDRALRLGRERKRRHTLKKALAELEEAGWRITTPKTHPNTRLFLQPRPPTTASSVAGPDSKRHGGLQGEPPRRRCWVEW